MDGKKRSGRGAAMPATRGRWESERMSASVMPIALAGGSFIFLGVLIVGMFGFIYGFYTRAGSGIDSHPTDSRGESPGAVGKTEASGQDQGESHVFSSHGVK